jgi:hypothetical protein
MAFGKTLGVKIPKLSAVYGIEIGEETAFGRHLSPQLSRRVEEIRRIILKDIEASLMLTTDAMISEKPEEKKKGPVMPTKGIR